MLRKALPLLLIGSWIILSGFDVTEDLDLPQLIGYQDPSDDGSNGNGPAGLLARNIVESATHEGIRASNLLEHRARPIAFHVPHLSQKVSKLHKVNHIFLI